MAKKEQVSIENAQLIFRNFAGVEGKYNHAGDRNFCVLIDDDIAKELSDRGYTVKYLKPREEGDKEQAYIKIKVSYRFTPPNVYLVSSNGKTRLTEENIDMADWITIKNADLIFNGSPYDVNGKQGLSAYLKTLYIVIEEDEFEQNPEHQNISSQSCIGGCGNCEACDGSCHED